MRVLALNLQEINAYMLISVKKFINYQFKKKGKVLLKSTKNYNQRDNFSESCENGAKELRVGDSTGVIWRRVHATKHTS